MYDISMDDALSDCWWCSVWWWCSEVFRPFTQSLTHSCMDHHMVTLSLALLNFVALAERKKIGQEEALTGCSTDRCDGTERNEREDLALFLYQYSTVGTMYEKVPILIPRICSIMRWTITSQSERTNELFRILFFPSQHSQPLFSNFKRGPNSHPQLSIHPLGIHFSLDAFASYFLFLPCCSRKPRTRIQTDVERVRQDT